MKEEQISRFTTNILLLLLALILIGLCSLSFYSANQTMNLSKQMQTVMVKNYDGSPPIVPVNTVSASLPEEIPNTATPEFSATPLPVAEQAFSSINLGDGSTIYTVTETNLEILSGTSVLDVGGHLILLKVGEIFVDSKLPSGTWFTVINPNGQISRVTGSIISVRFSLDPVEYEIVCIEGNCQFGKDEFNLQGIPVGTSVIMSLNGDFIKSAPLELGLTSNSYQLVYQIIMDKKSRCDEFEGMFVGTPCPYD
jgi:hypothetical protein